MNLLFSLLVAVCALIALFQAPDAFLSALIDGGSRAATICLSLLATYAVWMGLIQVWEDSGVTRGVSKLLRPFAKKLFKTEDNAALDALCMNLSVNLLGATGAATPYGVKAAQLLDKTPHAEYASAMFFALNATSLQLFPASVVAVRVAMHSAAPTDIVLPTFLVTLFSTLTAALLVSLLCRDERPSPVFVQRKTRRAATK